MFAIAKSTNVNDLQNALKTRTLIFDREEKEAGALSGQKGTYVELTDISKDLQNAVVATEDRSFYKNDGINYGRFFLAILTAGRSGGGSTITQQLAKNAYLSQDQTVERKAKEFFLALELTKKYSKEQILTMYLNNAYFGNGVWGVEDASKKYFGVSASQLTLNQAATLAGMLKGPELYNPLNSVETSTNRRDTVLQNMVAAGYIDKNQETEAAGVDMASQLQDKYEGKVSDYRYPSILMQLSTKQFPSTILQKKRLSTTAIEFTQSLTKTTKQTCRLFTKTLRYFQQQKTEHMPNQVVSL